jgi:nucleoside-diphosphate-sugar epimerase
MDAEKNQSVLVTGARGFVGRTTVKFLRRAGYEVVALDQSAPPEPRPDGVRHVVCDISEKSLLRQIFKQRKITGVVHLAAMLPTLSQREPARATEINVFGGLHLIAMAREFGVRRFVYGSSVSVYGTGTAEQVIAEADPAAPEDVYGAAKLYVEQLGTAYREHGRLEFVSLRFGRVLGPGANSKTSAWRSEIFEFLGADKPVTIPIPYLESELLLVVYLDDVASALVKLLQAPHPQHVIYNSLGESIVAADLKRWVEELNPNITVQLGTQAMKGNPRRLDSGRFAREFGASAVPIFERLRDARGGRGRTLG